MKIKFCWVSGLEEWASFLDDRERDSRHHQSHTPLILHLQHQDRDLYTRILPRLRRMKQGTLGCLDILHFHMDPWHKDHFSLNLSAFSPCTGHFVVHNHCRKWVRLTRRLTSPFLRTESHNDTRRHHSRPHDTQLQSYNPTFGTLSRALKVFRLENTTMALFWLQQQP